MSKPFIRSRLAPCIPALMFVMGCGEGARDSPLLAAQATPAPQLGPPPERVLDFPSDRSLGSLRLLEWGDRDHYMGGPQQRQPWLTRPEARGRVTIPAGRQVQLLLRRDALDDLSPLARLAPGALQSIVFNRSRRQYNNATGEAPRMIVRASHLEHIRRLTGLKHVDLAHATVDDRALRVLSGLTQLEQLNLGRSRYTPAGLAGLQTEFPKDWEEYYYRIVTDRGLDTIAGFPALERLYLTGNFITDASVARLGAMTHLKYLGIRSTDISPTGEKSLRSKLPGTRIDWTPGINAAPLARPKGRAGRPIG